MFFNSTACRTAAFQYRHDERQLFTHVVDAMLQGHWQFPALRVTRHACKTVGVTVHGRLSAEVSIHLSAEVGADISAHTGWIIAQVSADLSDDLAAVSWAINLMEEPDGNYQDHSFAGNACVVCHGPCRAC